MVAPRQAERARVRMASMLRPFFADDQAAVVFAAVHLNQSILGPAHGFDRPLMPLVDDLAGVERDRLPHTLDELASLTLVYSIEYVEIMTTEYQH